MMTTKWPQLFKSSKGPQGLFFEEIFQKRGENHEIREDKALHRRILIVSLLDGICVPEHFGRPEGLYRQHSVPGIESWFDNNPDI